MSIAAYMPYSRQDDGSSVDSFRIYCTDIATYPLLNHAQECDLARRAQAGEQAAFDRLCACNLRLVVSIAKHFANERWTIEELISEGSTGLMRAVNRFNPDAGYKFSTYATWWVKQAILRAQDEHSGAIRIPSHAGVSVKQLRRMAARLEERLHREPTLEELAHALDWTIDKTELIYRASQSVLSLSMPMSMAHTDPGDGTIADTLYAPDANPESSASRNELREYIGRLLAVLTEREQLVLSLRYGLEDGEPRTLFEVGQVLGVSRERVRQIESKALKKLREGTDVQVMRTEVSA